MRMEEIGHKVATPKEMENCEFVLSVNIQYTFLMFQIALLIELGTDSLTPALDVEMGRALHSAKVCRANVLPLIYRSSSALLLSRFLRVDWSRTRGITA